MRHLRSVFPFAIVGAFACGLMAAPLLRDASADVQPLTPAVIDLLALKHADLPTTANPEMNARTLVVTENATLGIQSGNIARHLHPKTDEIQYIVEGSGAIWLGNERVEFKPGTLIIIPKGVVHGGSIVSKGPVKSIAIKIPPQPKDGTVFVD
ncbi:MAG: cupin domain-containing protein [Pseudomonadota bacterium]